MEKALLEVVGPLQRANEAQPRRQKKMSNHGGGGKSANHTDENAGDTVNETDIETIGNRSDAARDTKAAEGGRWSDNDGMNTDPDDIARREDGKNMASARPRESRNGEGGQGVGESDAGSEDTTKTRNAVPEKESGAGVQEGKEDNGGGAGGTGLEASNGFDDKENKSSTLGTNEEGADAFDDDEDSDVGKDLLAQVWFSSNLLCTLHLFLPFLISDGRGSRPPALIVPCHVVHAPNTPISTFLTESELSSVPSSMCGGTSHRPDQSIIRFKWALTER